MKKQTRSTVLWMGGGITLLATAVILAWNMGRMAQRSAQSIPVSTTMVETTTQTTAIPVTTEGSQVEVSDSQEQVAVSEVGASPTSEVEETTIEGTEWTAKSMQVAQVTSGNFASMEGVWVNGEGQTLTFGDAGLIDGKGQIQGLTNMEYGTARGYLVADTFGGVLMEFLPIGTVFPDYIYDSEEGDITVSDASDSQRDRIWMGQDLGSIGSPASFYYRQSE